MTNISGVVLISLIFVAACSCSSENESQQRIFSGRTAAALEGFYYFFDPQCDDCKEVEERHLAPLAATRGLEANEVLRIDVTAPTGVQALLEAEKRYGFKCKSLAPTILLEERALCGIEAIRQAALEQ
jgi:hypothetical protein